MSLFPDIELREAEAAVLEKVASQAAIARLREREADFTPRMVARAVVEAVLRAIVCDRRHAVAGACRSIVGGPYTVWPTVSEADSDADLGSHGPWGDGSGGPLIWAARGDLRRVIRVLDICAGAGVWASEVRRFAALLGFDVHITAVDYEPDERPNLERHADVVIIGDWHEGLAMAQDERGVWYWPGEKAQFDVIIGNPAFSHARAATRPEWPEASGPPGKSGQPTVTKAEAKARKLLTDKAVAAGEYPERAEYDTAGSMPALCLECAPAVVLYTTQQCYTKTSAGWLTRLDYPYAVTYEIPSSIGHRGRGEGQDDKPYAAFMWLRGKGEPTSTFMLKPIADRNWDMRPGTEPDEWLEAQGIPLP